MSVPNPVNNFTNNSCAPCLPNCAFCTNTTICLSCAATYSLNQGQFACINSYATAGVVLGGIAILLSIFIFIFTLMKLKAVAG